MIRFAKMLFIGSGLANILILFGLDRSRVGLSGGLGRGFDGNRVLFQLGAELEEGGQRFIVGPAVTGFVAVQ